MRWQKMRLVALVVAWGLIAGPDGAALPGFGSAGSVFSPLQRRTAAADLVADDPDLCFSLRENDDRRQLLCNERRSDFNFNPFGLRFGKRYSGYVYGRAVTRARTKELSPPRLVPRELEVPT